MKKLAFVALFALFGLFLVIPGTQADTAWATCTDSQETITIESNGPLSYDATSLDAPAETCVTIVHKNTSQIDHDFDIEAADGDKVLDTPVIAGGAEHSVTVMTPAAGEYTFFCSVSGHRDGGMVGDFNVGGSGAPGFGFFAAFTAFAAALLIAPKLRKD